MKIMLLNLLLLISFTSCKKNDDQPPEQPPITAENTFSCKVNGELFIPEDFSSFPNNFDGYNISFIEQLDSFRGIFQNQNQKLYIYIYDCLETGLYQIGDSDGNADFLDDENPAIEYSSNRIDVTHVSTSVSGTIEVIELDFGTKIIFQFDEIVLQSLDDPNETITLTEGKANFNLDTFNN